jgi:uncharacterized protein YbjT (DUF2867 family)
MILVTGATGHVGSQVVRDLSSKGEPVRAFVRDTERARKQLEDGVELAVGDFNDPASVRRALEGVDRIFLSSGDGPQKVGHETSAISAAAAASVRLIVKASTMLAQAGSPLPGLDWNGRIEDHLRRSGVPSVILQSSFYMTNLLASAEQVREEGKLVAPAGRGAIAMIDPSDTGRVGAAVLTGGGHEGRTYVLTGPEAITYEQIAEALSAATARSIEFVDVPEDAAQAGLVQAGMPEWLVQQLVGVYRLIRADRLAETTDTVRTFTRRGPLSFADFAREHAALFGRGASPGGAVLGATPRRMTPDS